MSARRSDLVDGLAGNLVGSLVTTAQLRDLARRLRDVAAYVAYLHRDMLATSLWTDALELVGLADEEDEIETAHNGA